MALEDVIAKLTAAVERNNELVEKVLAQAGAPVSTKESAKSDDEGEDKPKRGRKPKEEAKEEPKKEEKPAAKSDDDEDSEVDFASVRKKAADWLGEFAKESDKTEPEKMHPEAAARKEKIKAIITKLGGTKLNDLAENADAVARLDKWLDKVKTEDKGFGPGRLAADPTSSDDDEDEDEV